MKDPDLAGNIRAAAIAKLSAAHAPAPLSDIDALLVRWKNDINAVRAVANQIYSAAAMQDIVNNPDLLRNQIQHLLLDKASAYNREELLLISVCMVTDAVLNDLI